MARTDKKTGAAFAGSQRQTQLYVNEHTDALNKAVTKKLPALAGADIEWVSPLEVEKYGEYADRAFLDCLGLWAHDDALKVFWPPGGPVWDALAKVTTADGKSGVLLGEGKSYPAEMYGSGCTATATKSRNLIVQSLAETQRSLGVAEDPKLWMGPLYQTANRLAHAYWLREHVGVQAWVVHLLFTNDLRSTTTQEWDTALAKASKELGLPAEVPSAVHVMLPAVKPDAGPTGAASAP